MRWASVIAKDADTATAFAAAASEVERDLGAAADLVAMFVSPHHHEGYAALSGLARDRFGDALVFGCSAGGVIGRGVEVERATALSLTAAVLPDVKLRPLRFADMPPRPDDWPERLRVAPDVAPAFVLLADPFGTDVEALVRGLDFAYPGAVKIGGLASGAEEPGGNALFLGEEVFADGAIGVALWGDVVVDGVVAQGCRPVGEPLIVTRCERNVLREVDRGRPLEVLQQLYASLGPADQALARTSLFLGVEMKDKREVYRQGDFLIRNLVGSDPQSGAIAVGALLEPYKIVQFHLRDAHTSAVDLHDRLRGYAAVERRPQVAGALLFSCLGRGRFLYDEPDHDSRVFREHLGDVPLGGFFCNGEIGPVGGETFLHGYTSAFGMFRPHRGDGGTRH